MCCLYINDSIDIGTMTTLLTWSTNDIYPMTTMMRRNEEQETDRQTDRQTDCSALLGCFLWQVYRGACSVDIQHAQPIWATCVWLLFCSCCHSTEHSIAPNIVSVLILPERHKLWGFKLLLLICIQALPLQTRVLLWIIICTTGCELPQSY